VWLKTVYNLKRVINILGITPLLDALKEKYRKIAELKLLLSFQVFCTLAFLLKKLRKLEIGREWLELVHQFYRF